MIRKSAALACAAVALALAAPRARAAEEKPKLVVLVVIDQFRFDYLERFDDLFDKKDGAFLRFKNKGTYFSEAYYGHATTYTGPDHGHIVTGGYANATGLVGNRWYDRNTGKTVPIAGDAEQHFLEPGDESEGTSPKNLIGTTVGDELVLDSQGHSKVISIGVKSRSSIMLGGKLGKSYWFDDKNGDYISSTYYMKELPGWVADWNKKKVADSYFGKSWSPIVPDSAFARASEDDVPSEGDIHGMGRTFPHKVTGKLEKPGDDFYDTFVKTPFATETELDFARAAVTAEKLGQDADTDLLAITLSANDEVGHTFGPYSREVLDMTVRTDKMLGEFLKWIDQKVPGAVVVLTADHGANPMPEYMAKLGIESYRIKKTQLKEAATKALTEKFGAGEWVIALEDPSMYLSDKLIAEKKLDRGDVEAVAARALENVPGIAKTWTRSQLLAGRAGNTDIDLMYERVFHPERSGDVLLLCKPYSFWGKYAEFDYGDSHGSPWAFDTHVPLAFYGPGIGKGVVNSDHVSMADVAPTLAAILHVNRPPTATTGVVLPIAK